ncbi:MAG: pilus assembly protein TadG-related protein [Candidatus Omnitrophota bacterium]
MLTYMRKNIKACTSHNGQVAVYFIGAMATLVVVAFIIINIGKTAKDKTHADNAADAAALAGCSVMATSFNYSSHDNSNEPRGVGVPGPAASTGSQVSLSNSGYKAAIGGMMHRHFQQARNEYKRKATEAKRKARKNSMERSNENQTSMYDPSAFAAESADYQASKEGEANRFNIEQQQIAAEEWKAWSDQQYMARSYTVDKPGFGFAGTGGSVGLSGTSRVASLSNVPTPQPSDGDAGVGDPYGENAASSGEAKSSDYHSQALVVAYKVLFQNAGIHHRLGRLTSKMYEKFLEGISEGTVQSGMPLTFWWVDGAARFHMVTGVVEIESANKHQKRTTPGGGAGAASVAASLSSGWKGKFAMTGIMGLRMSSMQSATGYSTHTGLNSTAKGHDITAQNPCLYPIFRPLGMATSGAAEGTARGQGDTPSEMHQALNGGDALPTAGLVSAGSSPMGAASMKLAVGGGPTSGDPTYAGTMSDGTPSDDNAVRDDEIVNSRMVMASCFQFHMGSPIKGIAADIDVMTFYPPVVSMAVASFNYTGMGNIARASGDGSDARHECGLVAAF